MKKRLLSLLMAAAICLSLLPSAALAETVRASSDLGTDLLSTHGTAGNALGKGTLKGDITVETGTYYLSSDAYIIEGSLIITGQVNLNLNGKVLYPKSNSDAKNPTVAKPLIIVKIGGNLTVSSTNGSGVLYGTDTTENNDYQTKLTVPIVKVESGGIFNFEGGQILKGNSTTAGGVDVDGGMFRMSGGIIGACSGVTVGGVWVHSGGEFVMSGGSISGCESQKKIVDLENPNYLASATNVLVASGSNFTMSETASIGTGISETYGDLAIGGYMYANGGEVSGKVYNAGTITQSPATDKNVTLAGTTFSSSVNTREGSINGGTFDTSKVSGKTLYTVTFNLNGHGSEIPKQYLTSGMSAREPKDPTERGQQFWYWYLSDEDEEYSFASSNITSDTTLNARWESLQTETVIFDYNGGKDSDGNTSSEGYYYRGDEMTIPSGLTKTGYNFTGWSPKLDSNNNIFGDALKYTAQWSPITYTVNLALGASDAALVEGASDTISCTYDKDFQLPAAKRPGYTFKGWSDGGEGTFNANENYKNLTDTQGKTITLTAQWEEINCANHTDENADNECDNCFRPLEAKYTDNDTTVYVTEFKTAYANAPTGSTITLLRNVTLPTDTSSGSIATLERNATLTIDLNGKTLAVPDPKQDIIRIKQTTLTIQGPGTCSASALSPSSGNVTLTGGVKVNTIDFSSGTGTLTVKNAEIGTLMVTNSSLNGPFVYLSGGTFGAIISKGYNYGSTTYSAVPVVNFLSSGYGYQLTDGTDWITNPALTTIEESVTVTQTPIKSVTTSATTSTFTYGEDITLSVTKVTDQDNQDITGNVTYTWARKNAAGSWENNFVNDCSSATLTDNTKPAPGTYTYQCMIGKDGYEKSVTFTVTVTKAELTANDFTAPEGKTNLTYSGAEQVLLNYGGTSEVTGVFFEYSLNNKDWQAVIPTGTAAQTYTVYWRVNGGTYYQYTGELDPIEVTIAAKDIANATITVNKTFVYNGEPQAPTKDDLTVTVGGLTLSADDYDLDVTPETNASKYRIPEFTPILQYDKTLTIKGKGNFTGEKEGTWAIERKEIDNKLVLVSEDALLYTGRELQPSIKIVDNDGKEYPILPGWHYTSGGGRTDGTNVGDTVGATLWDDGGGNYYYKNQVSDRWSVRARPLTEGMFTVTGGTYTGSPITPTVSGIFNSMTLVEGTDYTLSGDISATEAGTYKVTITGMGNYTGSVENFEWVIDPKSVDARVAVSGTYTYNGNEIVPDAENVKVYDGETLIPAGEYTFTCSSNTDAGTATLTLSDAEGGNYVVSGSGTFTIGKLDIGTAVITLGEALTYTGEEQTQTITSVKVGSLDVDTYDVTGDAATNAGTSYTLTVTGTGNFKGTATQTWGIAKADQTITADEVSAAYGDTDKAIQAADFFGALTYEVTSGDDVVSVAADGKLTFLKAGTATVTVTAAGDDNHNSGTSDPVTVTVGKKTITITAKDKGAYVGSAAPDLSKPELNKDYTIDGLVGKDALENSVTITLTCDADMNKSDSYEIVPAVTGEDSRYDFATENGKLTVSYYPYVPTKPSTPSTKLVFSDVPADAFYAEAVNWAVENDITNGNGVDLFYPTQSCTRAQIVTFLWRAAGCPEATSASTFSDVDADAYYAKAVAWAVENGITGGIGGGKFAPDMTCTREQAVTFLYRAAGAPAVTTASQFSDVPSGAYYADAVAWAAENEITGGVGGGKFAPKKECERSEIVTFLYRAQEK